ncbi:MAG TPA: hypothetical protein VFK03_00115, partial [Candidatus Saccharimonadales bacterium]|nr:hypothetical protein [Candidatus Saccharimonadales bacterium]
MSNWLKISHHTHTGKLKAHEHTSYLPLLLLLVLTGIFLGMFSKAAFAAHPGPEASSVGLTGTMPGKPPTVGAHITSPKSGKHFGETPVTVEGTCPKGTLVEIFKNNIFAGSTPCRDDGTFSIKIDLLIGTNSLTARVYDALNQAGPDSNKVTAYYDALPPQAGPLSSLDFGADKQLLLNTDAVYRGVFPGQELTIPIEVLGGVPPYAVNVQWGDTANNIISRNNNNPFKSSHTYDKPGTYQITLQASDSQGRVAFLTVAAIVNGQPVPTPATTETDNKDLMAELLVLWPLYTASAAAVT